MNKASKILIVVLCVVGILSGSLLAIYYYAPIFHKTIGGLPTLTCSDTQVYCGGTSSNGSVGWEVPANTMISTSFVTDESLSTFLNAVPSIIPYNIQSNSSIYFGLYVNGDLKANMSYNMSNGNYSSAGVTRTIQNQNGDNLAVFTNDFVGYSVSFSLSGGTSIPSGTTITVLMFANNPVWFQVANSDSSIHSYETSVPSGTTSLPNNITPNSGSTAPQTVAIGLFSDHN